MSITATVTKSLEPGFVQVDAQHKGGYTQYYKIPQKNANKFASELQKQDKDFNLYSNIVFFSSIFAGIIAAGHFTKHFNDWMKKFLVQTASAIGLSMVTSLGFNKYAEVEQNNLMNKYKAKEIFYTA